MTSPESKVLLVEPDPEYVELLVSALSGRFNAQITCVADAESCLDADLCEAHDLVVTEMNLPDATGLTLAEQLLSLRSRPILLLADGPEMDDVLMALRAGVRDVFPKPFVMATLLESAERALRGQQVHRAHAAKYRRMRELVRRAIRERRDLNQRVELVCRDLVGAQRRLVHQLIAVQRQNPAPPGRFAPDR